MASHSKSNSGQTLWKVFLLSLLIFSFASFFGPYEWTVHNTVGFLYFFLINALFLIGLLIPVIRNQGVPKNKPFSNATDGRKKFLIIVSVISTLLALYEVAALINYYGDAFQFLNGQYLERDAARTIFDKIAVVGMQFGTASYILYTFSFHDGGKVERAIIFLGLFACGIYYLFIGNRFTLAVEVVIFLVMQRMIASSAGRKSHMRWSKRTKLLLSIAIAILVGIAFLMIFSNRLHTEIPLKYEMFPGDQSLKPPFLNLYLDNPSLWDPFFMLADYMGEAPFVFSGLWEFYLPDTIYWFTNSLRPIGQMLSTLGFPSYVEIVEAIGAPAKYSGLAFSLVVDFGVALAPVVAFFLGAIFSLIDSKRNTSSTARALYPCCFACCIFAPIYYLNVGRVDYVAFALLILLFVAGPFSKKSPSK